MLLCSSKTKPSKVKMDSNKEAGVVIDVHPLLLLPPKAPLSF